MSKKSSTILLRIVEEKGLILHLNKTIWLKMTWTDRFLWSGYSYCEGVAQVQMEAEVELERPLTAHELYLAVQGLANGHAPGTDGIPVDFSKSFWSALGQTCWQSSMKPLLNGQLPLSFRRPLSTLLPKRHLKEMRNTKLVLSFQRSNLLFNIIRTSLMILAFGYRHLVLFQWMENRLSNSWHTGRCMYGESLRLLASSLFVFSFEFKYYIRIHLKLLFQ